MSSSIRIKELDYLRCIFIVLMVLFHLVYIGDSYPLCKKAVYTFHIPAFLLISGYLARTDKDSPRFVRSLFHLFFPYVLMETGYVLMASILPIRESIDHLSLPLLLGKIFYAPLGPYWYLHTLMLCLTVYHLVYRLGAVLTEVSRFICLSLCLYLLSLTGLLLMGNALYFLLGVLACRSRLGFLHIFQPSFLALLPLVLLMSHSENLERATLAGVVITCLVISFCLALYRYLPPCMDKLCCYIGCNTLVILLFSPVFTILTKLYFPLFAFDGTGFCFAAVSLVFVISGCFAVAAVCDRLHLSPLLFGNKALNG